MTVDNELSDTAESQGKLYGRQARIARLQAGETIEFGERGNSMTPLIKSGQKCTYAPVSDTDTLRKGDIVFCKVGRYHFSHLIK